MVATKKLFTRLYFAYGIISLIIVSLVYFFVLNPLHEKEITTSIQLHGDALTTIVKFQFESSNKIPPLKKAQITDFIQASFVGLYNKDIKVSGKHGKKHTKNIFKQQLSNPCGLNSIKENLKSCISFYDGGTINKIINGYFPIVVNQKFVGLLYIESEKYKIGNGLLTPLGLFIVCAVFAVLLIGQTLVYQICIIISNVQKSFESISKGESNHSSTEWVNALLEPIKSVVSDNRAHVSNLILNLENVHRDYAQLEENLKIVKDDSEKILTSKTNRLAQASHDIRSPLHTILATSEMLLETVKDKRKRLQITSIIEAGFNLKREVDNILVYEANELNETEVALERIDIEYEVDAIIQQIGVQYSNSKPVVAVSIIDENVPKFIISYKFALIKILSNLGVNARKFTESGSVKIRVSFQKRTETNGKLSFVIEDTGRGMSKEQVLAFGLQFKQYDNDSSGKGGVGLGLRIVNQYKEQINAQIALESTIDKGTTFKVSVDVDVEPTSDSLNNKKVLVIDSTYEGLVILESKFKRHGYQVDVINIESLLIDQNIVVSEYDILVIHIHNNDEHLAIINHFKGLNHTPQGVIFSYLKSVVSDKYLNDKFLVTSFCTPFQQVLSSFEANETKEAPPILLPLKVMSVDNEKLNLSIIESFLKDSTIEVHSFDDPEKAIQATNINTYDLILMDIFMPQMKGYEAAKIIKTSAFNSQTPIVACTATVSTLEKECIFESGMTDILIKPFGKSMLLAVINKHCFNKKTITTENKPINNQISKVISDIRGFGDLGSEESIMKEVEKLATLLYFSQNEQYFEDISTILLDFKTAFYYNTAPVLTVLDDLDAFLLLISNDPSTHI